MVLLDKETPGTSRETYIEEAEGDKWTRKPPDYKPSPLAIEPYSLKAIAGKELSLSSWCIASLDIYHFSTVIDFSSEKYSSHPRSIVVRLDTETPGTSREIYSEDAEAETRTRNLRITNRVLRSIELYHSKRIAGKELSLSSWCIASLYISHFSTVTEFSFEKYCASPGHRNS